MARSIQLAELECPAVMCLLCFGRKTFVFVDVIENENENETINFNSPRGVWLVLICVGFACAVENRAEPIRI